MRDRHTSTMLAAPLSQNNYAAQKVCHARSRKSVSVVANGSKLRKKRAACANINEFSSFVVATSYPLVLFLYAVGM